MIFTFSVVMGLLLGTIVLLATRPKQATEGETPTFTPVAGWIAIVLGFIGGALVTAGFLANFNAPGFIAVVMIGSAFAAVVIAAGGLIRKDMRWQNWVGLAIGGIPTAFWLVFAAGEALFPHS